MLRLISFILALGGLAVSALGIWLMMGNELPTDLFAGEEPQLERKVFQAAPPIEAVDESTAPEPVVLETEVLEVVEQVFTAPTLEEAGVVPPPTLDTTNRSMARSLPNGETEISPPGGIPQPAMMEPATGDAPPEPEAAPEPVFETTSIENTAAMRSAPPPSLEEQLYTVPIAYETPVKAMFNSAFTVTLAIDARANATSATGGLSGSTSTNIAEAEVQVTDLVRANLVGVDEAFTIEPENDKPQKLSKTTESVWRWKVTPLKSGAQKLKFEVFAVDVNNIEERLLSFDDTVTVEVSRIGQAMFLAQQYNPIVVILAGFGSLLAGIFGVLRFFKS